MVSLSPGEGGSGSNFLRASESPDKSIPSPDLPVLSLESMAARGLIKNFKPSFFSNTPGSSSTIPALNAPDSPSGDNFDRISGFSGSYSPGASEPLHSPQPHPSITEPFPAFDNEAADRLLDNITPAPSTTYFDPELAISSFQDDDADSQANTNNQHDEDEVETVKTETSIEAKAELAVVEEIETEVENAEPAQKVETAVTGNKEIDDEPELVKPAQAYQQVNSSPVLSPKSTTPDLDITPRALLLNPPVANVKPLQAAIWSTHTLAMMFTFSSTLGEEIVHFYVGPKRKEFIIHGNPLRLKSSFFKDFVFTVNADSGKTEHYLADADCNALEIIIDWVYRQGIEVIPSTLPSGTLEYGTDEYTTFTKAVSRGIEVYMLSAKFGMVDLQDLVMTELGKAYYTHQTFPSSADIAAVYAHKNFNFPLRKYMARSYQILADLDDGPIETVGWTAEAVDDIVSEVPALFKDFRALNRKSKGVDSKEPSLDLICSYHAHGVDGECVSKGLNFRGLTS
ncbi:hypothetical protein DL98DRAFT_283118 [Cadophora sp. DSE1049]|nr:hypothetical protein DL98DRAFT_283118 [Cadophora sp. DSE1049]